MSASSNMISIYETLYNLFEKAISEAYPDLTDPPIVISSSNNPKFGDYQCNSALPLCKLIGPAPEGKNQDYLDILIYITNKYTK